MPVAQNYAIQGLPATLPEYLAAKELNKLGIDYEFQSSFMGGRTQTGGVVADFYLREHNLILSVRGEYWHHLPGRSFQDMIQRLALISQGIQTIFIDEADILRNPAFYVAEALKGNDYSNSN